LATNNFDDTVKSGAPFARKFPKDEHVLDKIYKDILSHLEGQSTPSGWCVGSRENGRDPCAIKGDPTVFKLGPGDNRFKRLLLKLLAPKNFHAK